jgi:hypothetical protein
MNELRVRHRNFPVESGQHYYGFRLTLQSLMNQKGLRPYSKLIMI